MDDHPPARLAAIRRGVPAAGLLQVGTDVTGGHAVQHGFDTVAVAVLEEAGVGCAAHSRQTVFDNAIAAVLAAFVFSFMGALHFSIEGI